MIDGPVLQDIEKYKTKNVMGFSAREFIFLIIGSAIALLLFFLFGGISDGWQIRALICAIPAVPFFSMGFYRPFNQPLEKVAISFIEAWEPKDEVLKYAIHGLNSQIAFA